MIARCLIATSQTWPSTAVLPALLDRAGASVVSLSPGPLGLSGYVAERLRCSRDPQLAAAQLRALVAERHFDWTIVADEMLLRALLEGGDAGRSAAWLPVDPADDAAVRLLLSKHAFVERAAELGIPIPESRIAATVIEAMEYARIIGYPVVLKGDRGFGGSEVRECYDARALAIACRELFATNARLVVQRCIVGLRASACVLYDRGTVAAYTSYRAECCYPDSHSASTVHERFEHDSIAPVARALGRATGFHGMAGIDFMSDGDALYALEINPRPTIGFAGTEANRAFFAPAVRRLLRGESAGEAIAYDGPATTQSYFPGYLIYFANNLTRRDPRAWRRLFACLREARLLDGGLATWEVSRFAYDEIGKRLPGLHAAAQRARGLGQTPMRALPNPDRARIAP